jgi:hypothetical protein
MAGGQDVSLEDLLDVVMKTQNFSHFAVDMGLHRYAEQAYDEIKQRTAKEPDRYWKRPKRTPAHGPFAESLEEINRDSEEKFFATVQAEIFNGEQVYRRKDNTFAVLPPRTASRDKSVIAPVNERDVGLRQAVRLLRNAGFDVRWRTESTIERCAHAAHQLYFDVGQAIYKKASADAWRIHEDMINTPG